jgi:RNA 3'-terminal phosphate cyclase (ATP)
LHLDGSRGEGGGQVLRSALALAVATRTAVHIDRIRAARSRPGLMQQHLTAVRAAAAICDAQVEGATLGARSLTFRPGALRPGRYHFAVGTAGSACLVLQTVMPPLLGAEGTWEVTVEGGTHNPHAPPFDFLARTFGPLIARLGHHVDLHIERHGFHPAGGGCVTLRVEPTRAPKPLSLLARGPLTTRRGRVLLAHLPEHIAEREAVTLAARLEWPRDAVEIVHVTDSAGPGNAVLVELGDGQVTEVSTAFGARGRRAEAVAEDAAAQARRYATSNAPVGEHLADQLLLPLALGAGGTFRTGPLTRHTTTNIEVIRDLLPVAIECTPEEGDVVRVDVGGRHGTGTSTQTPDAAQACAVPGPNTNTRN